MNYSYEHPYLLEPRGSRHDQFQLACRVFGPISFVFTDFFDKKVSFEALNISQKSVPKRFPQLSER